MKLTKWIEGNADHGHGEKGILLKGGDESILSVVKIIDIIEFREECDGYFSVQYTKEETLKVVDELREWILND